MFFYVIYCDDICTIVTNKGNYLRQTGIKNTELRNTKNKKEYKSDKIHFMHTKENIIAIANGLEDVRFLANQKLVNERRKFDGCAAKADLLEWQYSFIGSQLTEIYNGELYKSAKAALREIDRPYSDALKATSGMSGFDILINLNKVA